MKKSLISVAASALLVAAITGCSSNGTSSSSSSTSSTSGGIQSSVQAIDGYVYNATGKAYYLAEDNASMKSVTLTANKTTKDVVTNVVTLGQSTYSLPADTNASVKSRIKFFNFTNTASSTAGTTFTPAAYFEADNVDGYDVNDTLMGATTLTVPANFSIASPLTQLVYLANTAIFGTTTTVPTSLVDLNTTTFAQLEANATKIATNLGLTGVNLLTADPVALAATNPTFRLVTALMVGSNLATATSILAAPPATTFAATLSNVAAALPTGTGKTLATALATSATNGGFNTTDIATMNIEGSVAAGTIKTLVAPTKTGKLPLNAITFGGTDVATLTAAGTKLSNSAISLDLNMSNVDGNVSNKAFTLYVSFAGNKANVAANESNNSGAINFAFPFELNATNSVIAPTVSGASIVKYEAKASDGSQVITKSDVNASTLSLTGAVTVASNIVKLNVTSIASAIIGNADANLTGSTGLTTSGISAVSMYVKDTDGAVIGVTADGLNSSPLAKGTFSSITGGLTATEALKVFNVAVTDYRTTTTGINNESNATSIKYNGGAELAANVAVQIVNYADAATTEANLVVVVAENGDTSESNATVTISGLPTWFSAEKATIVTGNAASTADFNTTVDTNLTIKDTISVASVKVTDEFGKVNAVDQNFTVMYNAVPVLDKTIANLQDGQVNMPAKLVSVAKVDTTTILGTDGIVAATCGIVLDTAGGLAATTCAVGLDGNVTVSLGAFTHAGGDANTTITITDSVAGGTTDTMKLNIEAETITSVALGSVGSLTTYNIADTIVNIKTMALLNVIASKTDLANATEIRMGITAGAENVTFDNLTAAAAATLIDFVDNGVTLTETELVAIVTTGTPILLTDADIITVTMVTGTGTDFSKAAEIDKLNTGDKIDLDISTTLLAANYKDVYGTQGILATTTDTITITSDGTTPVAATAAIDTFKFATTDTALVVNGFVAGTDKVDFIAPTTTAAVAGAAIFTTGTNLYYFTSGVNGTDADTAGAAATFATSVATVTAAGADTTAYIVISDTDSTSIYKWVDVGGSVDEVAAGELTLMVTFDAVLSAAAADFTLN
ncbi:beta strand repeat-containing protein [Sulfurimonas sp.]|uniref:beta strand repeat-containing protein n=1 Tax=Sulfurimonas sp. TaxID=2022749 RepID=UPI003569C3F7